MRTPSIRSYRIWIGYLLQPARKASSVRIRLLSIELATPRGVHDNPSKTQADSQMKFCSRQTDSGMQLLKTTPPQLIEHGPVEVVPSWNFPLLHSIFIVAGMLAEDYRKRNIETTQLQNF